MDIAMSDNSRELSSPYCNCYKATNLTDTILDSPQILNFKDRYVLREQLGWGQFGIIRVCSDKLTGEVLACKSIAKERLVTQDDVCSVKLEIEIMTRLSGHPNVVDLKAVYEEEDYVHLVMELCAGGELFHRLEKYGKFSEFESRIIFRHLMQVVMYCHDNGVVHRDLKPENILLASTSSSSPIKLADFGLATYIKPGMDLHGTVGSPFYIAPEVLEGGYNQAADAWCAGVILYILLSGMPPFWGKTKSNIFHAVRAADLRFPSDLWNHISASAQDLITGMLCVDPSNRLTAAQVLDHPWVKVCDHPAQEPHKLDNICCGQLEMGGGSFSTPLICRNRDYSFGDESPATADSQVGNSPAFTCRSSFSSFLDDGVTPCSVPGGFLFSSCCESNSAGFSSPFPSMPSFTFFSPCSALDQGINSLGCKANVSPLDSSDGASSLENLLVLSDTSLPFRCDIGKLEQRIEIRRAGTTWSKLSGIHSKRNNTIGLGVRDQLDLIVTESIIRWASCTHIPSATSREIVC